MPSCLIKGCFNTWKRKDSKVLLHVFPRDKDGIRLWLSQSPECFPNVEELVEKIYNQNSYGMVRLCSKHFNDDQYFYEGTKRRLRPNAIPTIFTFESPPSKTTGMKRKRKDANADLPKDGETAEGTPSSVVFITPTSAGGNSLVRQVLSSHVQIVLPSTSHLAKSKMADKAVNTDSFYSKKCQAVGTDPMLGKRNATMQTKPWKGKSQGVLCTILTGDSTNFDQHRSWQSEKIWEKSVRYPSVSKMVTGQVANNVLTGQDFAAHPPQVTFPKEEEEPQPISQDIKVEQMVTGQDANNVLAAHSPQVMFPKEEEEPQPISQDIKMEQLVTGQVANNVLAEQDFVTHAAHSPQVAFLKEEEEPQPISQDVKVERMSPHSDCGHSQSSIQDDSKHLISNDFTNPQTRIARVKDEDLESESSTDDSRNASDVEGHVNDTADEPTFTVLQSCLYDLIKLVGCQFRNTCHAPLTNVQVKSLGAVMAIDVLCSRGHNSTLWHSQAAKSKMSGGNLLPTSGGLSQPFGGSEVKTYIHNLEYNDELPQ